MIPLILAAAAALTVQPAPPRIPRVTIDLYQLTQTQYNQIRRARQDQVADVAAGFAGARLQHLVVSRDDAMAMTNASGLRIAQTQQTGTKFTGLKAVVATTFGKPMLTLSYSRLKLVKQKHMAPDTVVDERRLRDQIPIDADERHVLTTDFNDAGDRRPMLIVVHSDG